MFTTLKDIPIIRELTDDMKVAELLGDHIANMRGILDNTPTKDHVPILSITSLERETLHVRQDIIAIANMDDDRHEMLRKLGSDFLKVGIPVVAVLFSEAWIRMVDPNEQEPYIRPSQDPNKKEVLSFTAMTLDLKSIGSIYYTKRDSEGNMKFGDLINDGEGGVESELLRQFFIGAIGGLVS